MAAATATAAPVDREATAAADEGWNLPTDVFVEILLLLPPTKRWLLRIVCRHWRDVIHELTPAPERWSQPMALVFFQNYGYDYQNYNGLRKVSASAFVIDDLAEGHGTELWRSEPVPPARLHVHPKKPSVSIDTVMVGTCKCIGLLCLCNNTRPGGAINLCST